MDNLKLCLDQYEENLDQLEDPLLPPSMDLKIALVKAVAKRVSDTLSEESRTRLLVSLLTYGHASLISLDSPTLIQEAKRLLGECDDQTEAMDIEPDAAPTINAKAVLLKLRSFRDQHLLLLEEAINTYLGDKTQESFEGCISTSPNGNLLALCRLSYLVHRLYDEISLHYDQGAPITGMFKNSKLDSVTKITLLGFATFLDRWIYNQADISKKAAGKVEAEAPVSFFVQRGLWTLQAFSKESDDDEPKNLLVPFSWGCDVVDLNKLMDMKRREWPTDSILETAYSLQKKLGSDDPIFGRV